MNRWYLHSLCTSKWVLIPWLGWQQGKWAWISQDSIKFIRGDSILQQGALSLPSTRLKPAWIYLEETQKVQICSFILVGGGIWTNLVRAGKWLFLHLAEDILTPAKRHWKIKHGRSITASIFFLFLQPKSKVCENHILDWILQQKSRKESLGCILGEPMQGLAAWVLGEVCS